MNIVLLCGVYERDMHMNHVEIKANSKTFSANKKFNAVVVVISEYI